MPQRFFMDLTGATGGADVDGDDGKDGDDEEDEDEEEVDWSVDDTVVEDRLWGDSS